MTDTKRPPGVNTITREEIQVILDENEDLKRQLRIAERRPPSPNVAPPPPPKAAPRVPPSTATVNHDVAWRGTVLVRDDVPTLAGMCLSGVGVGLLIWAVEFIVFGFTAAIFRGAVIVALAAVAWWAVFARRGAR